MKNFLITICLVAVFVEVSGLLWSGSSEKPSETFQRLSQPPEVQIESPLQNGYFLLLGIATEASADPAQSGYEIWLEAEAHKGHRHFDLEKHMRGALRVSEDPTSILPEWSSPDPVTALAHADRSLPRALERHATLVKRYERWLGMAFEDWGYGHPGTPRATELLVAHRLYIAGGLGQQTKLGLQRLYQDTTAWRRVLVEAKTLPMKLIALTMVDDNVGLLSRALAAPAPDKSLLAVARLMGHALSGEESTLRWPIQNEFTLGLARRRDTLSNDRHLFVEDATQSRKTIAALAGLSEAALDEVAHPPAKTLLGMSVESQRTWEAYATYYEAVIKASETTHAPVPHWSDMNRSSQTLMESALSAPDFEPLWEPITQRLLEADARLRLAGLQVLVRQFSPTDRIGERLSLAGPEYFDPFSGLPMLWSATQERLYSVGKDGLDDGGDPTFDLVAPVSFTSTAGGSSGDSTGAPPAARRHG